MNRVYISEFPLVLDQAIRLFGFLQ